MIPGIPGRERGILGLDGPGTSTVVWWFQHIYACQKCNTDQNVSGLRVSNITARLAYRCTLSAVSPQPPPLKTNAETKPNNGWHVSTIYPLTSRPILPPPPSNAGPVARTPLKDINRNTCGAWEGAKPLSLSVCFLQGCSPSSAGAYRWLLGKHTGLAQTHQAYAATCLFTVSIPLHYSLTLSPHCVFLSRPPQVWMEVWDGWGLSSLQWLRVERDDVEKTLGLGPHLVASWQNIWFKKKGGQKFFGHYFAYKCLSLMSMLKH